MKKNTKSKLPSMADYVNYIQGDKNKNPQAGYYHGVYHK